MMPSTISTTIDGMRTAGANPSASGAAKATATTMSRLGKGGASMILGAESRGATRRYVPIGGAGTQAQGSC